MAVVSVPSGWAVCELGDVVDYAAAPIVSPDEIPRDAWVLELEDIEKDTSTLLERHTFAERPARSSKRPFDVGDVLYGKLRPYLNKILIADKAGFCSTEIVPLRATEAVSNRYVFYWLKHPIFREYVLARSHGLDMPRLGTESGKRAPFVLAPYEEQRDIADKLDLIFSHLGECRLRLQRVPSHLQRLREAVRNAGISGVLTEDWRRANESVSPASEALERVQQQHQSVRVRRVAHRAGAHEQQADNDDAPRPNIPATWTWAQAADVVDPGAEIVYGIVQPGPQLKVGVPYIRSVDIENGHILAHQLMKTSPAIAARYSRSALAAGDVLLGIIRATKVAIVPPDLTGANITQGTARLRPSEAILTDYLALVLEAPETQTWLHKRYRGIDMPGLNLADVRRTPVPLPPVQEQREIVDRVRTFLDFADRAAERHAAAVVQVEAFSDMVLTQAFRGELVPRHTGGVPAATLIEGVRERRRRESRVAKPAQRRRLKKMQTLTIHTLREAISGLPPTFSFDDLRRHIQAEYEVLKDVLFTLLDEPDPFVTQVFDEEAREMRFVRANV